MSTEARSNIYKIVDNTRATKGPKTQPAKERSVRDRLMPFLTTPVRMMRWVVYYLMMWLRPIVHWTTRAIAIPAAIIAVLAYVMGDEDRPNLPYMFAGASFLFFLFGWFYDSAILAIAPEPVTLL